jgi:hypothetical protein
MVLGEKLNHSGGRDLPNVVNMGFSMELIIIGLNGLVFGDEPVFGGDDEQVKAVGVAKHFHAAEELPLVQLARWGGAV